VGVVEGVSLFESFYDFAHASKSISAGASSSLTLEGGVAFQQVVLDHVKAMKALLYGLGRDKTSLLTGFPGDPKDRGSPGIKGFERKKKSLEVIHLHFGGKKNVKGL